MSIATSGVAEMAFSKMPRELTKEEIGYVAGSGYYWTTVFTATCGYDPRGNIECQDMTEDGAEADEI